MKGYQREIILSVMDNYYHEDGTYDVPYFIDTTRSLKVSSVEDFVDNLVNDMQEWLEENCSNEPQSSLTEFGNSLYIELWDFISEVRSKTDAADKIVKTAVFKNQTFK